MPSGNLTVIGTSHIAKASIDAVSGLIEKERPDIVAVELDAGRAQALMSNRQSKLKFSMIRRVGLKGFMFLAFAGFLQKRLGKIVGIQPGSDMKAAMVAAQSSNSKIALIDRPLEVTLRRLSSSITARERFRFFFDIIAGPFSREVRDIGKIDLRSVPDSQIVVKLISLLKYRYPGTYRVLVEERNVHMAKALAHIIHHNPDARILAVVGAGHEADLASLVSKYVENPVKSS